MDYKRIETLSRLLGLVAGIAVGKFAGDYAQTKFDLEQLQVYLVMLLVAAVSAELLPFLMDHAFGGSRLLRRLLLGRKFVEGTWVEVIHRSDNVDGTSVGILSTEGYDLKFSGDNQEGNLADGNFESDITMSSFIWPKLRYKYSHHVKREPQPRKGYGEIQFEARDDGCPTRYTGWYSHFSEARSHDLIGCKVTNPTELAGLQDAAARAQVIETITARIVS